MGAPPPGARRTRAGQAMIESLLVIVLMALILFGILEISRLYIAREILDHAAASGARARAVGFNDFMVHKVVRVAAIPNAGQITSPTFSNDSGLSGPISTWRPGQFLMYAFGSQPVSPQYQLEQSRIPLYLAARDYAELTPILDYADWEDVRYYPSDAAPSLTRVTAAQEVQLKFPMHRTFIESDTVSEHSEQVIDSHYPLYLE